MLANRARLMDAAIEYARSERHIFACSMRGHQAIVAEILVTRCTARVRLSRAVGCWVARKYWVGPPFGRARSGATA